MKTILLGVAIVAAFTACSDNNNGSETADTTTVDTSQTSTQANNTGSSQPHQLMRRSLLISS